MKTKNSLNPRDQELHSLAISVAKTYKKSEVQLIEALQKVDQSKLFYKLGFSSLFTYTTEALGLSEEVAYIYIRVARKAMEVPALTESIKEGSISISKAKRISSVINKNNQDKWLNLAKTETSRKIEREVAKESPKSAIKDQMSFVNPTSEITEKVVIKAQIQRVQLVAGISEKTMLKIRRVQEILSQKRQAPVCLEDVLDAMTEEFLFKNDPVEKAKRRVIKKGTITAAESDQSNESSLLGREPSSPSNPNHSRCKDVSISVEKRLSQRTPVSAALRHQLYYQFHGKCAHVSNSGQACSERKFLDIHHIKPISSGGTNDLNNLTLLCRGHQRALHLSQP